MTFEAKFLKCEKVMVFEWRSFIIQRQCWHLYLLSFVIFLEESFDLLATSNLTLAFAILRQVISFPRGWIEELCYRFLMLNFWSMLFVPSFRFRVKASEENANSVSEFENCNFILDLRFTTLRPWEIQEILWTSTLFLKTSETLKCVQQTAWGNLG